MPCYPIQQAKSTVLGRRSTLKAHTESEAVHDICKGLLLGDVEMSQIMLKFLQDVNNGLSSQVNPRAGVKCLITHFQNLPNGKERGHYLALDLGGSNFRVVLVYLDECNYDLNSKIYNIPQPMLTGTGVQLFNYVAESLSNFCRDFNICQKESLPLAFTFGFPIKQRGLKSATLERWSRGFMCSGTVGQDVVQMLEDAIRKRGDLKIDVVCLVTETTGTLMSCAWKNHSCRVGVVIGHNCTYIENKDKVASCNESWGNPHNPYIMVNVECACFGDDGSLDFIRTDFDKEIDKCSTNPGKQTYDKMVSGMNMGETVRLAVLKCVKNNAMFGGKPPERLQTKGQFYTKYVPEIESDRVGSFTHCREILDILGVKHPSEQDMINLRFICESVSKRSAHLVSACIATLIRKMSFPNVTIAVDGLLYRFHPKYHYMLMEKITQLCSNGVKLRIMPSEDGGGRGAAIAAAVAARLEQSEKAMATLKKDVTSTFIPFYQESIKAVASTSLDNRGPEHTVVSSSPRTKSAVQKNDSQTLHPNPVKTFSQQMKQHPESQQWRTTTHRDTPQSVDKKRDSLNLDPIISHGKRQSLNHEPPASNARRQSHDRPASNATIIPMHQEGNQHSSPPLHPGPIAPNIPRRRQS